MGFFEKIKAGLTRTKENIGHSFDQLFAGELNDDFYDELEETLILGDMGVETTMKAVEELRRRVKAEKIKDMEGARACLRQVLTDMLQVGEPALKLDTAPSVALFIGVNGVGKTTTIGKLAARMKGEGRRVLMAAADTFRAAAADQLEIWSERSGVELVRQYEGADPAAVVFDALPGQVFPAHVTSSDAGILAGQEAVNGQLSQPEQSTRWVRDAQRMRIHVALDEALPKSLPTGARATVQLYNSEGPFARFFSGMQIHLVSLLHYVY